MRHVGEAGESEQGGDQCPKCRLDRHTWLENGIDGYEKNQTTYCCEGCAEGTGCTCQVEMDIEQVARIEQESGGSIKKSRR